jgi:hypothetical protein
LKRNGISGLPLVSLSRKSNKKINDRHYPKAEFVLYEYIVPVEGGQYTQLNRIIPPIGCWSSLSIAISFFIKNETYELKT